MMGPSKWERHTGSKKKKWKESIKLKNSKRTLLSWVKFCFLLKDVNVSFFLSADMLHIHRILYITNNFYLVG